MSNFFFNKETATVVATQANEIINNKETSALEKAIAVSALVDNIYDTAHIVLGGVSINLFMTHALSELASTETRIQFINFVPTSVESLKAFREVNEAADLFYSSIDQYLNKIMDGSIQNSEEAREAIGALMPVVLESGLFKTAVDYADALVNETVTTVMKAAAPNNPI